MSQDLERTYIDELKTNAHFNQKHQQINEALDKYKTDYVRAENNQTKTSRSKWTR